MCALTRERPWWTREANPPCRPWCQDEHYDGEFAAGGSITCRKVLDEDDWFSVYVLQTISVDEQETPGELEVTESAVYHWLHNDEWTTDQAERYARALLAAVAFARTDNPR